MNETQQISQIKKSEEAEIIPDDILKCYRSIHDEPDMFNITKYIKLAFTDTDTKTVKDMKKTIDVLHHYVSLLRCKYDERTVDTSTRENKAPKFVQDIFVMMWTLVNCNYAYAKNQITINTKPLSVISRYGQLNPYLYHLEKHVGYTQGDNFVRGKKNSPPLPDDAIQKAIEKLKINWNDGREDDIIRELNRAIKSSQDTTSDDSDVDFKSRRDPVGIRNVYVYMESFQEFLVVMQTFGKDPSRSGLETDLQKVWERHYNFYNTRDFIDKENKKTIAFQEIAFGHMSKVYEDLKRSKKVNEVFSRVGKRDEKNSSMIQFSKTMKNLWNILGDKSKKSKVQETLSVLNYVTLIGQMELMQEVFTSEDDSSLSVNLDRLREYARWTARNLWIMFLKCSILLMDASDIDHTYKFLITILENNKEIGKPMGVENIRLLMAYLIGQRAFRSVETKIKLTKENQEQVDFMLLYIEAVAITRFTEFSDSGRYFLNQKDNEVLTEKMKTEKKYRDSLVALAQKKYNRYESKQYKVDRDYLFTDSYNMNAINGMEGRLKDLPSKNPIPPSTPSSDDRLNVHLGYYDPTKNVGDSGTLDLVIPYDLGATKEIRESVAIRYGNMIQSLNGIVDTIKWLEREVKEIDKNFFKYLRAIKPEGLLEIQLTIYANANSGLKTPLISKKLKDKRTVFDNFVNTESDKSVDVELKDISSQAAMIVSKLKTMSKKMGIIPAENPPYDFTSLKAIVQQIDLMMISGEVDVRSIALQEMEFRDTIEEEIKKYLEDRRNYPVLMNFEKHGLLFAVMESVIIRLRELIKNAAEQFLTTNKIVNATAGSSLMLIKNEEAVIFYLINELRQWLTHVRVGVEKTPGEHFRLEGYVSIKQTDQIQIDSKNEYKNDIPLPIYVIRDTNLANDTISFVDDFDYDSKYDSFDYLIDRKKKLNSRGIVVDDLLESKPEFRGRRRGRNDGNGSDSGGGGNGGGGGGGDGDDGGPSNKRRDIELPKPEIYEPKFLKTNVNSVQTPKDYLIYEERKFGSNDTVTAVPDFIWFVHPNERNYEPRQGVKINIQYTPDGKTNFQNLWNEFKKQEWFKYYIQGYFGIPFEAANVFYKSFDKKNLQGFIYLIWYKDAFYIVDASKREKTVKEKKNMYESELETFVESQPSVKTEQPSQGDTQQPIESKFSKYFEDKDNESIELFKSDDNPTGNYPPYSDIKLNLKTGVLTLKYIGNQFDSDQLNNIQLLNATQLNTGVQLDIQFNWKNQKPSTATIVLNDVRALNAFAKKDLRVSRKRFIDDAFQLADTVFNGLLTIINGDTNIIEEKDRMEEVSITKTAIGEQETIVKGDNKVVKLYRKVSEYKDGKLVWKALEEWSQDKVPNGFKKIFDTDVKTTGNYIYCAENKESWDKYKYPGFMLGNPIPNTELKKMFDLGPGADDYIGAVSIVTNQSVQQIYIWIIKSKLLRTIHDTVRQLFIAKNVSTSVFSGSGFIGLGLTNSYIPFDASWGVPIFKNALPNVSQEKRSPLVFIPNSLLKYFEGIKPNKMCDYIGFTFKSDDKISVMIVGLIRESDESQKILTESKKPAGLVSNPGKLEFTGPNDTKVIVQYDDAKCILNVQRPKDQTSSIYVSFEIDVLSSKKISFKIRKPGKFNAIPEVFEFVNDKEIPKTLALIHRIAQDKELKASKFQQNMAGSEQQATQKVEKKVEQSDQNKERLGREINQLEKKIEGLKKQKQTKEIKETIKDLELQISDKKKEAGVATDEEVEGL